MSVASAAAMKKLQESYDIMKPVVESSKKACREMVDFLEEINNAQLSIPLLRWSECQNDLKYKN